MNYEARISQAAQTIEARLRTLLEEKPQAYASVLEAMEYSSMAAEKTDTAPAGVEFCLLCGGKEKAVLDPACAVEMVHSYSLIHDDLPCMDDDDLRRGKPSCHIQFGESTALLAGDGLLTKAFETIAAAGSLDDEKKCRCILELSKAAGAHGMIAGQVIDLLPSENKEISEETLRLLCAKKTGEMIRVAARIGCICAGADEKLIQAADTYAEKIGLAFQIEDDILDIIGDEKKLGKPIGSDADSHKHLCYLDGIKCSREMAASLTQEAKEALGAFDSEKSGVFKNFG